MTNLKKLKITFEVEHFDLKFSIYNFVTLGIFNSDFLQIHSKSNYASQFFDGNFNIYRNRINILLLAYGYHVIYIPSPISDTFASESYALPNELCKKI
jgi:hypothetical protein